MAQKYVDLNGSASTDRIGVGLRDAAIHLSDGTLVFIDTDGTSFYLKYSSDHSTVNTIATLSGSGYGNGTALCRDSSDNLYVLNRYSASTLQAQAFTKGSGYTWTAQVIQLPSVTAVNDPVAVWCNTGGGTNGKGHILVIGSYGSTPGYNICDAGVLLAGSGTAVTANGTSPTFLGSGSAGYSVNGNIDLAADGFGATSGLAACMGSTTSSLAVGAWGISSSGTLSTNSNIANVSFNAVIAAAKIRLVRYAPNAWALVAPDNQYGVVRFSSTAQVGTLTDSGSPTNMPLNYSTLAWDVTVDPTVANQIWIYAPAAPSGGNQQMYRLAVSLGSGVSFAGAATADDLLTNTAAAVSPATTRAVKHPVGRTVDWQVFVETATTPTYALDGDYTSFDSTITETASSPANGATVTTPTPTLQVAVTDADSAGSDTVTFTIATDSGFTQNVHTFTTASQNDPLSSASFSATMAQLGITLSSLTTYYWKATVNPSDGVGSVTTSTQSFTTDFLPHAPTITAPTASSTYPTGSLTISWTDNEPSGSGLTQTGYQVRRSSDGGTTWTYWNGTTWTTANTVTSTSTSISTTGWTDQVAAWQVEVAVQNTNGLGPFSAATSFYVHANPVVTITAPASAGTVSTGGPTLGVTWTYSQAESLGEVQYRVLVQSAGGGTTYYDSLWQSGSATSWSINAVTAGIPTDTTGHALQVTVQVQDPDGITLLGQATNTFDIQWGVVTVTVTNPLAGQVETATSLPTSWTASSTRSVALSTFDLTLSYTQTGTTVFDSGAQAYTTSFTPNYVLSDFSQYTVTVTVTNANGVPGSTSVTFTTSQSNPASAYTPNSLVGRVYDVGINGVGYVLAPGDTDSNQGEKWLYSTIGKPLEPMRFATGETPFAQQIDHYHYTSLTDWRGGAGQTFLERDASVPNGFLDSDGVDPFTPYTLTLLKATATDIATTQSPCFGVAAGSNAYVLTGAAQLKYETSPGGGVAGTINLTGPTSVIDMCSDGQQWYVTDSTKGIYRGTTADPGSTAWSAPGGTSQLPSGSKPMVISYAGQRLCVGYGTGASTTPNVWSTLTDAGAEEVVNGRLILPAGWTVTKTTGGNGFLFFGASSGTRGFIYHYQLGTSTAPSVCWELPEGEIPIDLRWYQGQVLVRTAVPLPSGGRQMRLWRCPVDTSGNLSPNVVQTFGKNTDTVDNAAGTWGALGDKVFFSWYNSDGTNSGIGCIDLAQGGYARWHKGTGLGQVRSIFAYNGRVAFTQDGTGLVMEQTTYRTQGWVKSSLSDQNAVVGKVWDDLFLYSAPVLTGQSITLDYSLDGGTTYTAVPSMTIGTAGQNQSSYLLSQKAISIGLRLWLNGPGTSTPTLYRATLQVHQFGVADTMVQVPIDCGDYISDMKGRPLQSDSGPGKGIARMRALQNLLYTRVLFQDLDYQNTGVATVYELVQMEVSSRQKYDERVGKQVIYQVATVTLRKLSK